MRSGIAWTVNGSVNSRWFNSDIFYDVYLATIWPMHRVDVVAQQPKGRPYSLAARHFYASFKATVNLRELVLGFETRRRVILLDTIWTLILLADCLND